MDETMLAIVMMEGYDDGGDGRDDAGDRDDGGLRRRCRWTRRCLHGLHELTVAVRELLTLLARLLCFSGRDFFAALLFTTATTTAAATPTSAPSPTPTPPPTANEATFLEYLSLDIA